MTYNDFTIQVATINGSGSQSANTILVRSLFRMGLPVGGKNMFPSNIAGLPTWYSIRVNDRGFTGRQKLQDIVVAMNSSTFLQDQEALKPGGCLIYNGDLKFQENLIRDDVHAFSIPFRDLVSPLSSSVKLKKLLTNVVYAGVVCELLSIPEDVSANVIEDLFQSKPQVVETNKNALLAGRTYAKDNLKADNFPFKVQNIENGNQNSILIDGNSAAAIGLLQGGCTFAAWYPITPSSSLIERFESYASQYRKNEKGENLYSVIQGEDELSSICMVVGAGWAGARAMTATSGPGLSLMAEAAGLSYFAEIPAVIWNVQRVGPSTGLPTRTMQGDLLSAYTLSHGDTKHVVLLPGSPEECYEMGETAFDLAETLQTLVIVLSDLDIGMNQHITPELKASTKKYQRGKVLSANDLSELEEFARYRDVDGDGIPFRTLPGTESTKAAYFTRGTGHDDMAKYSENPQHFKSNMDRLLKKFETAKTLVPAPEVKIGDHKKVGIIYYGSSEEALSEALQLLADENQTISNCRLKALPLHSDVKSFIHEHESIVVIEQNRDQQLRQILNMEWPELSQKIKGLNQYDGLPLEAQFVIQGLKKMEVL